MKNPLKKLKAPKKKSKTNLSDVFFYVPLLISFVFAYFVYSKSNQLIISALIPLSVFSISLLFKKEKEEDSPGGLGPDRRRPRAVDPNERKRRDRSR